MVSFLNYSSHSEFSSQLNASRLKLLQAQDDFVRRMMEFPLFSDLRVV